MRVIDRFEHKYKINITEYHQIKSQIMSYMDLDTYTLKASDKKYLVKSLYYDTHDFKAYKDKQYGDYSRIKLRLRSYYDTYSDNVQITIELKTPLGLNMNRYSISVLVSEYQSFMPTIHWLNK